MPPSMQAKDCDTFDRRRPLVLFDGGCPLCRREIAHYRRLRGSEDVEWRDLTAADTDLTALGVDATDAMARLHVRDVGGNWRTGAYAFTELWTHLHGYALLARLLHGARLVGLLDWLYQPFARWRMRRRCTGQICAKGDDPRRTPGK